MTTQNMHPENHDVDMFVVEQFPVSETNEHPQEIPEVSDTVGAQFIASPEVAEHGEASPVASSQSFENGETQFIAPPLPVESAEGTSPVLSSEAIQDGGTSSIMHSLSSQTENREAPVLPFTAFMEEFRQAELRHALPGAPVEPSASPVPFATQESTVFPFSQASPSSTPPSLTVEEAATRAPAETTISVGVAETDIPAHTQESGQTVASDAVSAANTDTATEQPFPLPQPPAPVARPVSPLLRPPAPRARMPRHGNRHNKEQLAAGEAMLSVQTPVVPSTKLEETAPAEPPATQAVSTTEQPKPARRYRFDRPAATSATAASAPQGSPPTPLAPMRSEENKEAVKGPTTNGQATTLEREAEIIQQQKQGTSVSPSAEQPAPKQPVIQEPATTNGGVATPTAPAVATVHPTATQDRHRRHGQERRLEKEPVTVTPAPVVPVVEAVAPPAEPVVVQEADIAPEDLPPLEYSELQAASSRRRRRRRSSSVTTTIAVTPAPITTLPPVAKMVTTVTPEPLLPAVSVPSVVPMPTPIAAPRNVAPPATSAPAPTTQYNIVSGYTVNQMNHGNDTTGPFMGPEPSPARGSGIVHGARSIRNEAQRIPSYPGRTGDAGPSVGSMNQFANIVAQAIQAQTDRMVAELRRANQVPTNVSVTLPPFPSTERVGVFVDVANLLYSARTQRLTLDFGKLLDFLRGNRRLIRAHAYCPTSPQPGDEQMFLQAVKGLGYRITTKNYKTFSSGAKKADMDLDLCMDVVRMVDGRAVDCIVLVSGDGDFIPMLDYCSDHGVRVEVAAFDEAMSATLRQSCDLFINLSMLDEIRV